MLSRRPLIHSRPAVYTRASLRQAATESAAARAAEVATTTPSTSSSSSASSSGAAPAPPRKPKASSGSSSGKKKKKEGESDDDEENVKAEDLRGYKVLADGRKTTYFNNELSEETKKLIGDIAPKKIDPAEAPAAVSGASGAGGQPVGSAWNYAGTFEERNMTEWAKDKLKELLSGVSFVIPNVGAVMEVAKVTGLDGDASVTFVRGKKKCVALRCTALRCVSFVWRGLPLSGCGRGWLA